MRGWILNGGLDFKRIEFCLEVDFTWGVGF
jgi:hypothetical protein